MRPSSITFLVLLVSIGVHNAYGDDELGSSVRLVKKDERTEIAKTDYGSIFAADINFGGTDKRRYHLQFISLDPNSLFLPALLHSHALFYISAGNGTLSYTDGDEMKDMNVTKGDVYTLKSGSVFYVQSFKNLQLCALFSDAIAGDHNLQDTWGGPYSRIMDLFKGFDAHLLRKAFQAPKDVIEEIMSAGNIPPIVDAGKESTHVKDNLSEFLKTLLEINGLDEDNILLGKNKKKKHHKHNDYNLFDAKRNVDNCNGWSTVVTPKDLHSLKNSNIQAFMINLTTSSMVGPHWNPSATEVAVVVEGRGVIRVSCSSDVDEYCSGNARRFVVEKGDVFAVSRSQPIAQMSFNDEPMVLMGFSFQSGSESVLMQFLAGKDSLIQSIDKRVLGLAFDVNTTTISRLLGSKKVSEIQDCVSCAEEEEKEMGRGERSRRERKRGWESRAGERRKTRE